MKTIKTPIIPLEQTFVKVKDQPHELDYKAICVFSVLGFFLDTDTYWKDRMVLPPASINKIDDVGYLISSEPWFEWYYKPKTTNLDKVTSEFSDLFEKIIGEQCINKKIILPISGGLDSRTQAVALYKLGVQVNSYSYSFEDGYDEASISRKIADYCGFSFKGYTIKKEYLWSKIEELANINKCYSEFTHPRQMAVIDDIEKLGDVFSLGHMGDLMFDSYDIQKSLGEKELLIELKKKIVKRGRIELALLLWENWGINGDFQEYLDNRLLILLKKIKIDNCSAKLRAFKSMYYVPRSTSVNLLTFSRNKEIYLPYYDNRMCKFICEIPEYLLNDRQIQIEYIKKTNPNVAKVVWQDAKPFNLFNYKLAKTPLRLPHRIINKFRRELNKILGVNYTQRNWEIQFLGKENDYKLKKHLFSKELLSFVPVDTVEKITELFKNNNKVIYSDPISTLLTLSIFFKRYSQKYII
tara:strand:- start:9078 stop:10481 length:1404 start_codon:yes stop_codon:yes gene_type:complete